jgi:hypothetical protein
LELSNVHVGAADYSYFFGYLQTAQALTFLKMDLQGIEGLQPSFASLTSLLRTNRILRRLELSRVASAELNGVLESIYAGLSLNRSLREFHIAVTGDSGALSAELLERCQRCDPHTYTGVTLPVDNPLAGKDESVLKQNRFGRRLFLNPREAPLGLWARVLGRVSAAGEQDVMFQFLRTNPRLRTRRGIIRARSE